MPGGAVVDYAHATDEEVLMRGEEKPWCFSSQQKRDFSLDYPGYILAHGQIYLLTPARRSEDLCITFEPATSGCSLGALMILHANIFDICRVIIRIEPQDQPKRELGVSSAFSTEAKTQMSLVTFAGNSERPSRASISWQS
jgi:hypothetical protein